MRVGTDLVRIARVRRLVARRGKRALGRLLTDAEVDQIRDGRPSPARLAERVAGRFAAKEAVMKMLGTGWGAGVAWHDVEVLATDPGPRGGPPRAILRGEARRRARSLGLGPVAVSISHDGGFALAVAAAVPRAR